MIGAGWVIQTPLVAFVFHAELAGWIMAILSFFSCRNFLGIFFWLREIDGDFQISVGSLRFKSNIFSNCLDLDVIIFLAKLVKISYSLLGIGVISHPEVPIELARGWCDEVHELSPEYILLCQGITNRPILHSQSHQIILQLN